MGTPAVVGNRVRQLRLIKDYSQADLSRQLQLNGNAQISKLETGRFAPDPRLTAELARALGCREDLLLLEPLDALTTRPWLRAYADASVRAVDGVLQSNLLHHEVVQRIGLKRIPEQIPTFGDDLSDDDAIEAFAEQVRAAAGIEGDAEVGNVMRALERLGCVILPLEDELGRHLGLSQYIDGIPYVRVSRARPNVPGDRQRFTVAHELGHLALHANCPPPESAEAARRIENQAHRFAGAFLTPRQALLDDLDHLGGRVTLNVLQELKRQWGVAIKMLVTRLRQLSVIEEDQAVSMYKQISRRGWNSGEPVPVSHESAIWFSRALEQRWVGQDSILATADHVGLTAGTIRSWLDWSPRDVLPEGASVIPMPSRTVERAADGRASIGSVTRIGGPRKR